MLTGTVPGDVRRPAADEPHRLGTGRYFLKVRDADYDTVCRGGTWYMYASTSRLREMLDRTPNRGGR